MGITEQAPLPNDSDGITNNDPAAINPTELIDSFLSDYGQPKAKDADPGDLVDENAKVEDFPPEETPVVEPEKKVEPVVAPPADTGEKLYTWKGQKYTAKQLAEQGILEDALTGAEQTPHFQRLYNELKEQVDQVRQAQQQAQPQQQQQAGQITPTQVLQAFAPEAVRMAKEGYIEEDFVDAYPNTSSALIMHRNMIYELRQVVGMMVQGYNQAQQQANTSALQNQINGMMDEIAREEAFGQLNDQNVRNGYWDYLKNVDPYTDRIDQKFLRDQFMAYNASAILEAARSNATTAKVKADKTRQTASGEASGTRPQTTTQPKDTDTALLNSFLEDDKWPTGG